ncbi:hypothetical protein LEMLEM_LOCUS11740 [Lemmus lemmus]
MLPDKNVVPYLVLMQHIELTTPLACHTTELRNTTRVSHQRTEHATCRCVWIPEADTGVSSSIISPPSIWPTDHHFNYSWVSNAHHT